MKILVIGQQLHSPHIVTGLQTFNIFLCHSLRELGHEVHYAIAQGTFSPVAQMQTRAVSGSHTFHLHPNDMQRALARYDQLILSDDRLDFGGILRATQRPALVWSHGQHISPLRHWDGAELRLPGVQYVAINGEHLAEAQARGFEKQAVMIDMPVQFFPRTVRPGGGYCAAVGTLEERKNYPRVVEIADEMGVACRAYGAPASDEVKAAVEKSDLDYRGLQPREVVLNDLAGADFLIHAAEVEGRPTAVLEANGLGVPVICPDLPLYREFVNPARNVLLDPARPAAEQLAEVDLDALRSEENRQALAEETHAKYGVEAFRAALAGLLGV